jgi:hypothetical protein
MKFFDANARIGKPVNAGWCQPVDADGLLKAMDRSGIEKALVWHVAQLDAAPQVGNELLTRQIAPHDRLVGCWTLLPSQTGEMGDLDAWFAAAAAARVKALRAWPGEGGRNRYLLRAAVLEDVLDGMAERNMPLIMMMRTSEFWQDVCDLLLARPNQTVVLSGLNVWGSDRYFRPLIERYRNVYIEIGNYVLDGGIEAFVESYGPDRLLFGTGFPEAHHGGIMLSLRHAEIPDPAKEAIAFGNLERLLEGVRP